MSVAPLRDVRPGGVVGMLEVLEGWEKRCVGVLGELEGEVREVRRRAGERKGRGARWEGVVGRAMVTATGDGEMGKGSGGGKRGAGDGEAVLEDEGLGGEEEMEIDVGGVGRGGRIAKRGGGGGRFGGLGRRLG